MDIQHLVDRLEDLIDEGRHMPFSKFTMIDEERALELIDQMRISIPEEIEKAARILAQRDRIIAQANEEAARIVQLARERSDQLIDREAMVQAAQARAASIIEQARRDAEEITEGANEYVVESLSDLETTLLKALQIVRNGIREVTSSEDNASNQTQTPVSIPVSMPTVRPTVEVGVSASPRKDAE